MSHFRAWPWPRVLAHRGAGTLAPENTLAALRVGFEHGFRAVEFDAMAPRDDVPVLIHDDTLDRTTGTPGDVTARTAEELTQLDVGRWHSPAFAGEPVPRLSEALAYCRARSIWPNVEIKPAPGHEVRTGASWWPGRWRWPMRTSSTPGGDDRGAARPAGATAVLVRRRSDRRCARCRSATCPARCWSMRSPRIGARCVDRLRRRQPEHESHGR